MRFKEAKLIGLLAIGYLWFLLGIAWAPSNKIYQQGLVALLWLPALLTILLFWRQVAEIWRSGRVFCTLLLLFIGWAALSSLWTEAPDVARELKRVLYVVLFLGALALLSRERPDFVWTGLAIAFIALAVSCPVSIYVYYILDTHPLVDRLQGLGQVDHPILGAYVMAIAAMWGGQFLPQGWWKRLIWLALLLMVVVFIALGQSRGAMLALGLGVCSMPLWVGGRRAWIGCLVVLIAAGIGYQLFEPFILQRGLSYRPEIFAASVDMILHDPVNGLGIGSPYRVVTANYPTGFDHSHNAFTHVAIQLGLVGAVLWGLVWLNAFGIAWRHRQSREGRLVLGTLIVSFVALQFDAASLWGTPRAEWFVTWLPLGLALALVARNHNARLRTACP